MIVCVPVTSAGQVDHRWGRAEWIAVANIVNGEVESWQEIEVSWDRLHDEGTPAQHHARVARFLRQNHVEGVVAHHVGDGMVRMLDTMRRPNCRAGDVVVVRLVDPSTIQPDTLRRNPSDAGSIAQRTLPSTSKNVEMWVRPDFG